MMRKPNNRIALMAPYAIAMLVAFAALTQSPAKTEESQPERSRFLLLDSRVIASAKNARLSLGVIKKHEANPLFVEEEPWEKRFDNLYGNVIYDKEEKIYKCWYSPFIVDNSAKGMTLEQRKKEKYRPPNGREMGVCYATSKDGIKWKKPELDICLWDGEKSNILVRKRHGSGIFKDLYEKDPARRYKMYFKQKAMDWSFSPDGLRWSDPIECVGGNSKGDTHNNLFWAPTLDKYVGITRTKSTEIGRQVARTETGDFETWKGVEVVLEGLSKNLQTYAMPVFYHGGIYIGLVAIHNQATDRVWTELAWSPDTFKWNRVCPGEALIANSEKPLDYDYGCVYPCAYPVFLDNEIRLYYGGSDYLHYGWRNGSLCLATLRPDGFAGYEQENTTAPAIITTSVIPYSGEKIRINADMANGGSVKASVLDGDSNVLSRAETVSKMVIDAPLEWSENIAAQKIRLRFELYNAKLYSFSLGG